VKIFITFITIAGIVAGAFHAYNSRNQYIEAALLSEAYVLVAPLKLRVAEYYLQKGVMPHSNAEAGVSASEAIFGTRVKRIAVNRGGVLRVDFADEIGQSDMVFTPTASADQSIFGWRCTSDSIDPAILEKLRPTCSHLPSTPESQLMNAIANADLEKVKQLVRSNADVNAVVNGNTPLMLAARVGNSAVVKFLIDQNADIDHLGVNKDRRTPLMVAITSNRAEVAAILLSQGASVVKTDYQGKSALDYAKDTDSRLGGERFELMVTARLNPKFAGKQESNLESVLAARDSKQLQTLYDLLRSTAHECNTQRLRTLLTKENEFPGDGLVAGKPFDSHKVKPLCSTELLAFIKTRSIYQKALNVRLSHAFRSCDVMTVRSILDDNPTLNISAPIDNKLSYFDLAVHSGCVGMVNDLIREYSLKGSLNPTLLVDVIQGVPHDNLLRLVGALLEAGVDVNAKSADGESALIASIAAGQPVVAKYLIDAGANVNERSVKDSYAVIEASKKGYQHLVSQLIAAGADINRVDSSGRTAIIAAVDQGKSRLVDTLLRAGANPNKRDNNGVSARILAESSGKRSIQKMITATSSTWK